METKTTENIYFRFDDADKSIFMRDLTDKYNETSAYNNLKRNYKQAKADLLLCIDAGDRSTFWQWIRALDEKYKLKMHVYCAMD